jgi:hypothetical protein
VPEGRSYECYSDKECSGYLNGYPKVLLERFSDRDKWGWYPESVQTIHYNLWADHKDLLLLGKIEAERQEDGKVYMKVWTEVYDLECNLLNQGYDEGYRKEK